MAQITQDQTAPRSSLRRRGVPAARSRNGLHPRKRFLSGRQPAATDLRAVGGAATKRLLPGTGSDWLSQRRGGP